MGPGDGRRHGARRVLAALLALPLAGSGVGGAGGLVATDLARFRSALVLR